MYEPVKQVCVRILGPDLHATRFSGRPIYHHSNHRTVLAASACLLHNRILVTTASIVVPFLEAQSGSQPYLISGACLEILLSDNSNDNEIWHPVKLISLLRIPHTQKAFSKLISSDPSSWTFGWGLNASLPESESLSPDSMGISTLAICLVDLPSFSNKYSPIQITLPHPGSSLIVHSSPFALASPAVLANSVSHGVLSNIVKVDDGKVGLLMIDVRILPGMEGGAVFSDNGSFIGMVLVPLRRKDGEPVDFAFIIPAYLILEHLNFTDYGLPKPSYYKSIIDDVNAGLSDMMKTVVSIEIGNTWASGLLISADGYVLTNAHVFYSYLDENKTSSHHPVLKPYCTIRVGVSGKWYHTATLPFISLSHWDLALVKLEPTSTPFPYIDLSLASKHSPPPVSTPVLALGYGLYPPSIISLDPTTTAGTISRIIHLTPNESPVMLVATARAHRGNSGGPLIARIHTDIINSKDNLWKVVGIVSSNAKMSTGQTVTELAFVVPISVVECIGEFVNTRDSKYLDSLVPLNEAIEDLWMLKTKPPESDSDLFPVSKAKL